MKIEIRALHGHGFIVEGLESTDTVAHLKQKIQHQEKYNIEKQRLIFAGKQLNDGDTLGQCNIHNGVIVRLVTHLAGMISSFTTNEASVVGNPFDGFLLGLNALPSIDEFISRWHEKTTKFDDFIWEPNNPISPFLSEYQCKICMQFLDNLWIRKAESYQAKHGEPLTDLKVKFDDTAAVQLLLSLQHPKDTKFNENALQELFGKHIHHGAARIAFRCTRGPVPGAISWHFDGGYATDTVQVALNDDTEYEGGRLCYFTPERGVEVLSRKAGDLTKHNRQVLHAVTRLTAGTRYSLFVVDANNDLGDQLVVHPSMEETEDILSMIQYEMYA